MFLKMELWDEEPRHDNHPIVVGSGVDASLDMKTMKARIRPINVFTIISFEHIRIYTNGRPGTSEDKQDTLSGVRIRLCDGAQYVVIDSVDLTFEKYIQQAKGATEAVVNVARSSYMEKFAPTK